MTQVRNREALLAAGWREKEAGEAAADFSVIDMEWVARPIHRLAEKVRGGSNKGWTTLMAVRSVTSYAAFDQQAFRKHRGLVANGAFNVVHKLTPLSPTVA